MRRPGTEHVRLPVGASAQMESRDDTVEQARSLARELSPHDTVLRVDPAHIESSRPFARRLAADGIFAMELDSR